MCIDDKTAIRFSRFIFVTSRDQNVKGKKLSTDLSVQIKNASPKSDSVTFDNGFEVMFLLSLLLEKSFKLLQYGSAALVC